MPATLQWFIAKCICCTSDHPNLQNCICFVQTTQDPGISDDHNGKNFVLFCCSCDSMSACFSLSPPIHRTTMPGIKWEWAKGDDTEIAQFSIVSKDSSRGAFLALLISHINQQMFTMPFRRKKSDKSFPVKVITFDSELEFKLEVSRETFVCIVLTLDTRRISLALNIDATVFEWLIFMNYVPISSQNSHAKAAPSDWERSVRSGLSNDWTAGNVVLRIAVRGLEGYLIMAENGQERWEWVF